MNTDRVKELKLRIRWLAIQGKMAARAKDKTRTLELLEETKAAVNELAELTQDEGWQKLSDEGDKLHEKFSKKWRSH